MVYSTCSMNPIENEAVVAEILRKLEGFVELVDVSDELPQLVRRPGLKKWKVHDKGVWLASDKEVPKYRRSVVIPSMFPSGRSYCDSTGNSNQTIEPGEKYENGGHANSEDAMYLTENIMPAADELDEEVSDFPLERCMRRVPHDQNTGAFFIAVFHKNSPLPDNCSLAFDFHCVAVQEKPNCQKEKRNNEPPSDLPNQDIEHSNWLEAGSTDVTVAKSSEAASEVDLMDNKPDEVVSASDLSIASEENISGAAQAPGAMEPDSSKAGGKRRLQMQGKWKGVDPVVFFRDEAFINSIKTFYGIVGTFPLVGHLLSRNLDNNHVKRIYYISKSVKDVLELNFSVGRELKIASIGLKLFERQTSREGSSAPCSFRISSEGLPVILPYITKQILHASPVDFKHLLQYKSIKYADFVDAEFGKKASDLIQGCCVVALRKDGELPLSPIQVDESTIAIGCWKGKASLTVMINAVDCQELLERLPVRTETEKSSSVKENNSPSMEEDEEKDRNDPEKNDDKLCMEIDG